ncbi:DUF2934 domain-containing protein [Rhizobium grahamii]|uniref:DUF2934 domain-containing protein n=2 Tax=Rhizobium grahamii TaxID=1120045 RepID=S3I4Z0_9HYPH|nr:DUF2934 domain-containing protein [Rhizobium grahamii]EPE94628.1 hypothetical protein RGCCGE502_29008 [Rhizobium grahamii CCGE 502]RDJ06140.1 hypothetical protein B5K06_23460 [Rhizobium grahamii]
MSGSKDDWINQRAYALWEAEGRPDGRSGDHWQQAAREYQQLELTRASVDGSDLVARLRAMGRLMRAAGPQIDTVPAIDEHKASA